MTPENFVYWLQGHLELNEKGGLTAQQVKVIREHVALVLTKVTPKTEKSDAERKLLELARLPRCSAHQKLC